MKIFKKGQELPVKDFRGKIEVTDLIKIIEDDDLGTYIVEFTNTSKYLQDFSFMIKQIPMDHGVLAEQASLGKVSHE